MILFTAMQYYWNQLNMFFIYFKLRKATFLDHFSCKVWPNSCLDWGTELLIFLLSSSFLLPDGINVSCYVMHSDCEHAVSNSSHTSASSSGEVRWSPETGQLSSPRCWDSRVGLCGHWVDWWREPLPPLGTGLHQLILWIMQNHE